MIDKINMNYKTIITGGYQPIIHFEHRNKIFVYCNKLILNSLNYNNLIKMTDYICLILVIMSHHSIFVYTIKSYHITYHTQAENSIYNNGLLSFMIVDH